MTSLWVRSDTPTALPCVRMRVELCAISWIPWQAEIRERESSRSEFVSTVQSPRIQVRPPAEQPRANILTNISTRSGASFQVNEARVMPFSDSRERTEPASWARPSWSSNLTDREHLCNFTGVIMVVTVLFGATDLYLSAWSLFSRILCILLELSLFFALAFG